MFIFCQKYIYLVTQIWNDYTQGWLKNSYLKQQPKNQTNSSAGADYMSIQNHLHSQPLIKIYTNWVCYLHLSSAWYVASVALPENLLCLITIIPLIWMRFVVTAWYCVDFFFLIFHGFHMKWVRSDDSHERKFNKRADVTRHVTTISCNHDTIRHKIVSICMTLSVPTKYRCRLERVGSGNDRVALKHLSVKNNVSV